ncbi:hypothetical protein B484DRAFT_446561 [Ochromonadaceae sp. CCMP2298]|nr:hypothetical protein B484DRAFT_446561 [Ochromonadaceae sp. CCMP2298]
MNRHTFKDVAKSKRSSLANDLDEDEEEVVVGALRKEVEGEEDDGVDKFNDAGEVLEAFNLKDEREGGYFDENMNYVFKEDHAEVGQEKGARGGTGERGKGRDRRKGQGVDRS